MKRSETLCGGCACGAIRYEINTKPAFVFNCHCRDCQRATGCASAPNAWFPSASVNCTMGLLKSHVTTGESGKPVYHEFCGECGSSVGMRSDGYPDFRAVRMASLDNPDLLRPVADIWTGSKISWDTLHPSLPHYESVVPEKDFMEILNPGK